MRDRPPQGPYASDAQLTDAILDNLWDGNAYNCPVCDHSTPTRSDFIPHLQQHIDDILRGRIPYSIPIPTPPKRD